MVDVGVWFGWSEVNLGSGIQAWHSGAPAYRFPMVHSKRRQNDIELDLSLRFRFSLNAASFSSNILY